MKIKDIQVDGFGVWSGLKVDGLCPGMTAFYGPNEAGKTTLMQFLRSMLYGFTPERRQRYLPPVFGGRPGGVIRVTGPGGGYEIARRDQLGDTSGSGQLTVTGGDGTQQGQHRLAALLGHLDEDIFTNVFAIGLRELQELSTLDDTSAANELYKLSSGLDRVSLVDCLRQLQAARGQMTALAPDPGPIQRLLLQREQLKQEIDRSLAHGRRWGELATIRRSQGQEIQQLRDRIGQWELEVQLVQLCIKVRQPWQRRYQLIADRNKLKARLDLDPHSMPQLDDLDLELEQRREKLEAVRQQRLELRRQARQLPLRPTVLELASKIEAAVEQGPWIAGLQKQLQRLDSQIVSTGQQLAEDAERLGLSNQDQQALLQDRRLQSFPDLNRQSIQQLNEPAQQVRTQRTRLKHAQEQAAADEQEVERLGAKLSEFMANRPFTDLHQAIEQQSHLLGQLKARAQADERVDKLQRRCRELEQRLIDLRTDEALPLDKAAPLALPFVGGGLMFFIGIFKMVGWITIPWTGESGNGMLIALFGLVSLLLFFMWRKLIDRGTGRDIIECEGELEAATRQLRKAEQDRDEVSRQLPSGLGPLDQQARDVEKEIGTLEGMLPTYHNYQAASERHRASRQRAAHASQALKRAHAHWEQTLQQLGLAPSLSPTAVRVMADGYESLTQTRRRLLALEDERDQRRIEHAGLAQRVEALARQVQAAMETSRTELRPATTGKGVEPTRGSSSPSGAGAGNARSSSERFSPAVDTDQLSEPLPSNYDPSIRLQQLANTLADQRALLQQRRDLRQQDQRLVRQQRTIQRGIEKQLRARHAWLSQWGVEDRQQLESQLAIQLQYHQLSEQIDQLQQQIEAFIGGVAPYQTVADQLEGPASGELEERQNTLQQRIEQAELRVSQLLERQGEITQEMKTLAGDTRGPTAKLELAAVEQRLRALSEHWRTLATTTSLLERVCEIYETERQPETLREASSFLGQLTDGKYRRVWTPLGKNALRIENADGVSLPLEQLSRGTREAVFIALRLALTSAYSRRGMVLPMVLDDVLVNFDAGRALLAAKVLRDFGKLGHQVIMFTCHQHIMHMLHDIDVQVRILPRHGEPGEAIIYRQAPPPAVVVAPTEPAPPAPLELVGPPAPIRLAAQPEPQIDHLWYETNPLEAMWEEEEVLESGAPRQQLDPQGVSNRSWRSAAAPQGPSPKVAEQLPTDLPDADEPDGGPAWWVTAEKTSHRSWPMART
jgi:uncharacterized protein YhaN